MPHQCSLSEPEPQDVYRAERLSDQDRLCPLRRPRPRCRDMCVSRCNEFPYIHGMGTSMSERIIEASGKRCPCGDREYRRVDRCDDSTDFLNIHYDICDACGFETNAYNDLSEKRKRYEEWKMEEHPTIFNVFAKELQLVRHEAVYDFLTRAFQNLCPRYFWYIPASVRGHHPPICRTQGGLVHHVKLAVAFADSFLDMLDIDDDLRASQIIAAVLLHDMLKRGKTEEESDTWPDHRTANRDHGRYCANKLTEFVHSQRWSVVHGERVQPIITAVRLHMGRWTWLLRTAEAEELKLNEIARTTHLADYAASRALHHYLAERAVDESMEYLKQ